MQVKLKLVKSHTHCSLP